MPKSRRIVLKLDLEWPYKRHTGIFAGAHRYAQEQSWKVVIDEFVERPDQYDGIIARATETLARGVSEQVVALVNVRLDSPTPISLPGGPVVGCATDHLDGLGFHCWSHGS